MFGCYAPLVMDERDISMRGLDARMSGLAERMDGLDARMDGLDARMDRLDARLAGLEKLLYWSLGLQGGLILALLTGSFAIIASILN